LKKINLAIGIHNHQPVGNFDFVFEEAYQKAYLPFLRVHEQFPEIRLAQHYTGILFEWISTYHPEFIPRLRKLVTRGQIEMMTGGYYEPILITISDDDKIGQIRLLTKYVKEKTGFDAAGTWLAERVWEPDLPKPLVEAGITYSVIDDAHFKYAGLREEQLYGYYLTEHEGALLKIFPISERLRYTIPFRPPEETIEYLRSIASEDGQRLAVFADDGEKFGVWPHTYEQCYENKWLENFFRLLLENREWINLVTFQQALETLPPQGRVYLPTASYREMMEWAMPARTIHKYEDFEKWLKDHHMPAENKVFVHGGFWRNFLAKYPESNNMHKRMLRGSQRLHRLAGRKSAKAVQTALNHVYAGQCNCPYWHGVFGGLYLPNLRYPIYHNLIQADVAMDKLEKKPEELKRGWVVNESVDFDSDGYPELIVESDRQNLFFAPQRGGALFEWDVKWKAINLLDTMTRREEGYHRKLREAIAHKDQPVPGGEVASIHDLVLMKEENLDQYLNYDWYRRSSLIDHFLHPYASLEAFYQARYGEQGDFVDQPYKATVAPKAHNLQVSLVRDGHVWIGDRFSPIRVSKQLLIQPKSDVLVVQYNIHNLDKQTAELWFGIESAFALMAGDAPDRYYYSRDLQIEPAHLASMGVLEQISHLGLCDEWLGLKIDIELDQPTTFWRFPIETVSMSEAGFERVYQCSVVMPHWRIQLKPGKEWSTVLRFALSRS